MDKAPEISPTEIEKTEVIGSGSFGKVYRGKCRGQNVAIKILLKQHISDEDLATFKREVAIMSTFSHPNICLFMGACTQPGNFFIVQEFLPGGDVEKLLHDEKNKISLFKRMQMAKDAALGINWLHLNNPALIHRDLKSSNLLIDENMKVKVCDFGLSQVKPQGTMLVDDDLAKGTPLWMAPEVMQFQEFNEKADVYSFGIVLWEFLTRKPPFAHHSNFSKFRKAVCEKHERPDIPPNCEPSLKILIQRCWHPDPNKRPAFDQIISLLDNVLVDVAVKDVWGRKLWKDNFVNLDEVPWKQFSGVLRKFLRIPDDSKLKPEEVETVDLNFRCLKAILVENPRLNLHHDHVSLEYWGKILEWFGPIGDPESTPYSKTILDSIRLILKEPWFHGDADEREAQQKLSSRPGGTFMVRFSSIDGWYTISQISQERVIHHKRVKHKAGDVYIFDDKKYPTLQDLVHSQTDNLITPLEGSRFQHIFCPPESIDYNYES
eukprot:TRINITY_DN10484_c0_g1_i1.p1 TRINITY_DN10484_c0_g1~~TRINITY_DN10484_c0_g1_i1.p1  ORF type:complete len:491 (+),score=105.96 TRINITY_DN10484_c0_g1_i1:110-1582(+)